ncbi:MAG: (2Fe-2S)-binding protein [Bacillus sp. (in: Bacteria)]|nr:(2Fe-2S)-binding protein [Bacillus sp. (in: firmicutes)]
MASKLTSVEILLLQKYRLSESLLNPFNVVDLQDEGFLRDFIKNLADTIGAPTEKIAAPIFIKRYAFLAVISLYAMSAWNKKVDVSLENVSMENFDSGKEPWLPLFSLTDGRFEDWNGENRDLWRKTILKDLFANNIYPIIEKLEKTFQISKLILWENIAVYLFWLYENELKDSGNENVENDFRYLILEAEGQLFGPYHLNPFHKYFGEKMYSEEWDKEIRIRKTCCFSYQLPAGKRCKTCPCSHFSKDGKCHDGESICEVHRK